MIIDYAKVLIEDPSYIADAALSFDGLMGIGAMSSLLVGTTMLTKFTSGGKKGWLSPYGAWKAGLYGDKHSGIILGRYNGHLVCYNGSNHIGIPGPTGTGKTACAFLATLLMNKTDSFFVFDQSGDLWRLTSGIRSQYGRCYRLHPGLETTDCLNPLNDVPDDNRIVSTLTSIMEPLFAGTQRDQKKTGGDPFWDRKPKEIMPFIIMQVLYGENDDMKHMRGILEYIAGGERCFHDMARNPRHPQCRQVGIDMLTMSPNTRQSVMATITAALSLWRDDAIAGMTRHSSLHIEDLATGKESITVYLTAPTTDIQRMMPFYVMLEELMKVHLMNNVKTSLSGKPRLRTVVIADDEAQNTKRPDLDSLETQRKFRIRSMFGYQSTAIMDTMYGEGKLSQLKTKLFLRPEVGSKDQKIMVEKSGKFKKKVISETDSRTPGKPQGHSKNWRIEEKPRLTEGEIEAWPQFGNGLLVHDGKPAVLTTFDAERDPEFTSLILPEYRMDMTTLVRPSWGKICKPVILDEEHQIPEESRPEQIGGNTVNITDSETEDPTEEPAGSQVKQIRVTV